MYRELFQNAIRRFDEFLLEATGEGAALHVPGPVREAIDLMFEDLDLEAIDSDQEQATIEAARLKKSLINVMETTCGPYCGRYRIDEILNDIFGRGGLETLISICTPRKRSEPSPKSLSCRTRRGSTSARVITFPRSTKKEPA